MTKAFLVAWIGGEPELAAKKKRRPLRAAVSRRCIGEARRGVKRSAPNGLPESGNKSICCWCGIILPHSWPLRRDRIGAGRMRHALLVVAGNDVDVEHHQAAAELEDAAMAEDRSGRRLAHEVDVDAGGHRQRVRPGMRQHADIAADVGQREQRRPRHRVAGPQMALVGIQPHGAAAGEDVDRLVEIVVLVELRVDLGQQLVDLADRQKRLEIGLFGHVSSIAGLRAAGLFALARPENMD